MEWFEQELDLARSEGVTHPGNFPFLLLPATPNRPIRLAHPRFQLQPQGNASIGRLSRFPVILRFTACAYRVMGPVRKISPCGPWTNG